jgi:hypothetical protein
MTAPPNRVTGALGDVGWHTLRSHHDPARACQGASRAAKRQQHRLQQSPRLVAFRVGRRASVALSHVGLVPRNLENAIAAPAAQDGWRTAEGDALLAARANGVRGAHITRNSERRLGALHDRPATRGIANDLEVEERYNSRLSIDVENRLVLREAQHRIPCASTQRAVVLHPQPCPLPPRDWLALLRTIHVLTD